MIGFLAPLFLAGLATVAIPVILHLIHRRRARSVLFSTLRFLALSQQRVARRQRLREMLMLLLRCALLALLALTFAAPILRRGDSQADTPAHAALVIDDSFSMGLRHRQATSFELARDAASAVLDELPKGSEAALFFTGGNRDRELPALTPSLTELKTSVLASGVSATAAPVESGLARAAAVLNASTWPKRELYVFTDLQRASWQGFRASDDLLALIKGGAELVVVDCGAEAIDNCAVAEIAIGHGTGPAGSSAISATVRNFSREARSATLSLFLGGDGASLRLREPVDAPPKGAARATLALPAEEDRQDTGQGAALLTGRVEADPDALAIDDARYFAVPRHGGLRVLVVGDAEAGRASGDSFYIETALRVGGGRFDPFFVPCSQLASIRLDDYAAVVAGSLSELTAEAGRALCAYVRNGGGLVLFLGPDVDRFRYNEALGGAEGVLPAPLGDPVQLPEDRQAPWERLDLAHPIFESFAGPLSQELSYVRTRAYMTFAAGADLSAARVLVAYADGAPAILEQACGAGRAIVFTSACDGRASNLPMRASFVPILHQAVAYLGRAAAGATGEHLVGAPIEFVFAPEAGRVSVQITAPTGEKRFVISELEGARNRAVFRETDSPGLYAVLAEGAQDAPRTFAVNVDVTESDLARLDARAIKEFLPTARLCTPGGQAEGGVATIRARGGVAMAGHLLACLIALGLAESILGALFTPRRGSEGVRARSVGLAAGAAATGSGGAPEGRKAP